MMDGINTGGPAFPVTVNFSDGGEGFCGEQNEKGRIVTYSGMTLRDYFAAKAMQGCWAKDGADVQKKDAKITAEWSYQMADAMLAAREKGSEA